MGMYVARWALASSRPQLLSSLKCSSAQLFQPAAYYSPNSKCRDIEYKPIRSVLVANRGDPTTQKVPFQIT